MTPYNTLKKKSTNKNHYNDNYSASIFAMHALFAFVFYLPDTYSCVYVALEDVPG